MDQVARHYDRLLAKHYVWMSGLSVTANAAEQRSLFEACGIASTGKRLAVDLGCGPGFQALALAEMGFDLVVAVDTSATLLGELESVRGHLPITTIQADLRKLSTIVEPGSADAITCMGDTLTLLDDDEEVSHLLLDVHTALAPGGVFVATFRDLSSEMTGLDRFLPLRSDADRIMICVLEYQPATVTVTDLIHVREGDDWTLHKSSYRKLRLDPALLSGNLARIGFTIERATAVGAMHIMVARKASTEPLGLRPGRQNGS